MNFQEYQIAASRTCATLGSIEQDNLHMILGMLTEIGELADVFKKNIAYGKPIDWVNVKEEIADLQWYVANFCRLNEIDMDKILENNIQKLQARFPEKFNAHDALNRNLLKERKILESDN